MTATVATGEAPRRSKRTPVPLNGVNTPTLLATIDAVGKQPELARFQFRATSRWVSGTHSQSTMLGFYGAGGEHEHILPYKADGDHPAVLCGADAGPTPVEWVLHAIATCLMSGIGNIAAARGIRLSKVEASLTGDIDLRSPRLSAAGRARLPLPAAIGPSTRTTSPQRSRGRRGEGRGEGQQRAPTPQRPSQRLRIALAESTSPFAAPHPNALPASGERESTFLADRPTSTIRPIWVKIRGAPTPARCMRAGGPVLDRPGQRYLGFAFETRAREAGVRDSGFGAAAPGLDVLSGGVQREFQVRQPVVRAPAGRRPFAPGHVRRGVPESHAGLDAGAASARSAGRGLAGARARGPRGSAAAGERCRGADTGGRRREAAGGRQGRRDAAWRRHRGVAATEEGRGRRRRQGGYRRHLRCGGAGSRRGERARCGCYG